MEFHRTPPALTKQQDMFIVTRVLKKTVSVEHQSGLLQGAKVWENTQGAGEGGQHRIPLLPPCVHCYRLFFVRFQKNSRPAEKNSRPILGKKLNLSEANSDFTKKLQTFYTQNNVFHGGHTLQVIFIDKFLIFSKRKYDFNGFFAPFTIIFGGQLCFFKNNSRMWPK